ncbi:hypothetical protein ACFL2Q_02550 [Thermodesulfobacteriota bacterium]
MKNQILRSFEIEDALSTQDTGAIGVTVTLDSGERRWCFFMTPTALSNCGDWINGTQIRFHFGAKHMIVVAADLDETIIGKALTDIDRRGELLQCTRKMV